MPYAVYVFTSQRNFHVGEINRIVVLIKFSSYNLFGLVGGGGVFAGLYVL